jgi:hypothetical protein
MAEKLTRREKKKEKEEERGKEEVEDEEEVENEVEGVEAMDESPLKEEKQATNGTQIQCSQREEPTKLGSNTRKDESTRGKVSWGPNTTITSLVSPQSTCSISHSLLFHFYNFVSPSCFCSSFNSPEVSILHPFYTF